MMKVSAPAMFLVPALVLAAGCSSAPREPNAREATLMLRDGGTVEGRILRTTTDEVTVQIDGETSPRVLTRDQIEPLAWYQARAASMDADARIDLARWCIAQGLYEEAGIELAQVVEMHPDLEEALLAELLAAREARAQELLRGAESAFAAGDGSLASNQAAEVVTRFADTSSIVAAQGLVDRMRAATPEPQDPEDVTLLSVADGADSRLIRVERYLERGAQRRLTALQRSGSAAREAFDGSITDHRRALALLDKVIEDGAAVDQLTAGSRRADALRGLVEVYIDLGNFDLSRGSYTRALEAARAALDADPGNDRAEAFVRHVEVVTADQEALRRLARLTGRKMR